MEKIGMTRDPRDDFDNRLIEEDSPRRPFVIYRMTQALFATQSTAA
jgi:hypothetical protein